MLQQWEKDTFTGVFKKCFGLQDGLKSNDGIVKLEAITVLAVKSGFRVKYITENLNEISNL